MALVGQSNPDIDKIHTDIAALGKNHTIKVVVIIKLMSLKNIT
jgi:hypothetical protein